MNPGASRNAALESDAQDAGDSGSGMQEPHPPMLPQPTGSATNLDEPETSRNAAPESGPQDGGSGMQEPDPHAPAQPTGSATNLDQPAGAQDAGGGGSGMQEPPPDSNLPSEAKKHRQFKAGIYTPPPEVAAQPEGRSLDFPYSRDELRDVRDPSGSCVCLVRTAMLDNLRFTYEMNQRQAGFLGRLRSYVANRDMNRPCQFHRAVIMAAFGLKLLPFWDPYEEALRRAEQVLRRSNSIWKLEYEHPNWFFHPPLPATCGCRLDPD